MLFDVYTTCVVPVVVASIVFVPVKDNILVH